MLHQVLGVGSRLPVLRDILAALHRVKHRQEEWMRPHPFDMVYGTTTNGYLPPWLIRSGDDADAHVVAYGGCQPSCVRRALTTIQNPEDYTFIDLGCGKGRAVIIASELPFRRIVGVELAPGLAAAGRRNARLVQNKYPSRSPIEIIRGDATAVPFPDGNLVMFLYHSFGSELVAKLLDRVVDAVAGTDRVIFLIFENPVNGALVDANPQFTRWFSETVRCTASEAGFAPHDNDSVVVWRIDSKLSEAAAKDPIAPIIITMPGLRATLGPIPFSGLGNTSDA